MIVAIKGARVSDYGGKSLNVSADHSDIFDAEGAITDKRYDELKFWAKTFDRSRGDVVMLSSNKTGSNSPSQTRLVEEMNTFCQQEKFLN